MNTDPFPRPARRSVRMLGFDYAKPGAYFITICAARRRWLFGHVAAGRMVLSPVGALVSDEWSRSASVRSEIHLDAFVVMPNHVHGVVWIGEGILAERTWDRPAQPGGTRPRSLSSFVQGYKAAVTSRAAKEGAWRDGPLWHRGFYEHVIRSERKLAVIRRYIRMNPARWARDPENVSS